MEVSAQNLVVRRNGFALDVPRFHADAGGTAVLGPNGAGKTTLLLALQDLLARTGTLSRPVLCSGVFAQPAFLRGTARFNITEILRTVHGLDAAEAGRRADVALDAVGLREPMQRAHRLSSGQRQRLALARALALEPDALFLDEPFANVDAEGRPVLRDLVRAYVERAGCALVIATQVLADAMLLSSHVLLLESGRVEDSFETRLLPESRRPYVRSLLRDVAL
jgi:ABC-type multidrug transport system ATPase subunit